MTNTHFFFVIVSETAFGSTMYAQLERNPDRDRLLSPFGTDLPQYAAQFNTHEDADYAIAHTANLRNPKIVKLKATIEVA